ncbi:MAG: ADP-ribosylation factor-like protein [Chloroflexota bacterium]
MFINQKLGEINIKIVYYGPPLSGKTTNLEHIHQRIPAQQRGELVSLKTRGDRTLFFDYMQLELPPIQGMKPKFNLYTVPGQVAYTASRKLVLQGADAVIFVADSQSDRMQDNLQSLYDLYQNLKEAGTDPQQTPLVVQFNKRDLEDAAPTSEIKEVLRLQNYDIPSFEAVATQGDGVIETLKLTINNVLHKLQSEKIYEN